MTRPDPRAVDRAIASDPKIVGLLADYVQGIQRVTPTPKAPSPNRKSTPIPKPKPAPKKREAVKISRKTRAMPKQRSTGVTVDDPGAGRSNVQPTTLKSNATTDARSIAEPTPCKFCGGEVERQGAEWSGVWRFHRSCHYGGNARRVQMAAESLEVGSIDEATALAVTMRVQPFHEEHVEPTYTPKASRTPWGHVDRKALLKAVSDALTERAEVEIPRACVLGRCAWCGVAEAVAWDESPYKWADGSDAPLCDDCGPVFARRGEPSPRYMDDARSALAEAVTGVPGSLGVPGPAALLAYVEAEGQGTGAEAWDYLPAEAVEAFRWSEWAHYGGRYAPPEHRAEALARAARPITAEVEPDPFNFRGEEREDER